jgi:mannonate dehydratase
MKLGIGLYRHMLSRETYRFARQLGCSHVIIHLVDYTRTDNAQGSLDNQPVGSTGGGWGKAGDPERLWTTEVLRDIKGDIEAEGLVLQGIENFDPAHWHDVLLDGPKRAEQMEGIKQMVRRIGEAGIPMMGYNFSIAGVAGRVNGPFARGGAESVGVEDIDQTPVPLGMVWNMIYDPAAPAGVLPPITSEELWSRLTRFLREIIPVAEEAGVVMAAHPDDPPAAAVRGTPRLVYQPSMYQRLLDAKPSRSNALEFCVGTIAEMTEGNVYDATEQYSAQGKLAYVHLRNIRGRIPRYHETFIDEGDVDILRVLRILRKNRYDGILIPDHTPLVSCDAPWHAGMAYALGYMRAALQTIDASSA